MAGLGGVIGTVLGWLGYQVGLRTDAASSTGSLHAKVKYIMDNRLQTAIGSSSDTRASNTVMGWLSSQVKSVQRGYLSMSSDTASQTVTISPVNVNKAILLMSNTFGGSDTSGEPRGNITSSTTLTFSKREAASGSIQIEWQVIEFY